MFELKKFLAENKLTEASRLDEYPASGPYKNLQAAYNQTLAYMFDAQTVVYEWMVSEEKKGNVSQSDRRPAQAYKDVKHAMMNAHRQLKKWQSVMEGVEKVKHQQRGK